MARLLSITTAWLMAQSLIAQPGDIIATDVEPRPGRLIAITETTASFVEEQRRPRSLPLDRLVRWGALAVAKSGDQLLLADGSVLVGRIDSISEGAVRLKSYAWGALVVPRDMVQGVIWSIPAEAHQLWRLRDQMRLTENKLDLLTLANKDQLQGTLIKATEQKVTFKTVVGEVSLEADRLQSWRSARAQQLAAEASPSIVGLSDGSRLVAKRVQLGPQLRLTLLCGLQLDTLPDDEPVEDGLVSYFRPANPNVVYLSDLESLGHKHIPLLSVVWDWQRDRSVLGGPLSWGRRLYDKGIGMHSASRLAFDLDENFAEFQAEAALDATAKPYGSVVFRVYTFNSTSGWTQAYASDVVRPGTSSVSIRLELRQATRLALVVDYADRGDVLDRANWIGARLLRD